ncbi:response regulator [Rahnella inusitata]|uniref:Response regulator n=2 Tax=Rahnella inusitata TaxID=58169 RepID=A0ABX9P0D1_9GAMM|nr:response regulator [Rahnella inusitata]
MMSKRILLADSHPIVRLGVKTFLESEGYDVITEATNGEEALFMAEKYRPSVIILDIDIPRVNGIEVIYHLMAAPEHPQIIVFSAQEHHHFAYTCLQAGAAGYVHKTASLELLVSAIEAVSLGHAWFPESVRQGAEGKKFKNESRVEKISRCERRVMSLLLQGKSNNEISQMLNRSPKTISAQKKTLFSKLNITSLAELMSLTSAMLLNTPTQPDRFGDAGVV